MAIGAAAAIAVAQMYAAGSASAQKGLNEARRLKAQNKAKIAQLADQFSLDTQNMYNNEQAILENKLKNDFNIQESKLQAEDAFSQAFIGSGISGRTKDIRAAELQNSVSKAHNESSSLAKKESNRQFLGLIRSADQRKSFIEDLDSFDVGAAESNTNMVMLQSGLSSVSNYASSGAGQAGLNKAFS